jgi:L-fuconolactonase
MPGVSYTAPGPLPSAAVSFVDSHVHFWHLSNGWYPRMERRRAQGRIEGLGDLTGLPSDYEADDLLADGLSQGLAEVVHVGAVELEERHLDETRWLERMRNRTGAPAAIIAQVTPSASPREVAKVLDQHLGASPAFRGVRTHRVVDHASAPAHVLTDALAERGLVYDMALHGSGFTEAARLLEDVPSLTVVLEHVGWPLAVDDDYYRDWRKGIALLAALPNVHCKLSGIAMTVHTFETKAVRPWYEFALEQFGVARCFFGSNFPVDALFGSYAELVASHRSLVADYDDSARNLLFASNARAVYGMHHG